MKKIKVTFDASQASSHGSFTLDDLGINEEVWSNLSEEEKRDMLQNAIDSYEQPYWVLNIYEEQ